MITKEAEIRAVLVNQLGANSDGRVIVAELGVNHGQSRIDVATIGKELVGYEIKSDADNLSRLPAQMTSYNDVFERVVLVTGKKHIVDSIHLIPEWWGITLVQKNQSDGLGLYEIRPPGKNPGVNPLAMARLLWRREALEILEKLSSSKGVKSKTREQIYIRLARDIEKPELCSQIKQAISHRPNWRFGRSLMPGVG